MSTLLHRCLSGLELSRRSGNPIPTSGETSRTCTHIRNYLYFIFSYVMPMQFTYLKKTCSRFSLYANSLSVKSLTCEWQNWYLFLVICHSVLIIHKYCASASCLNWVNFPHQMGISIGLWKIRNVCVRFQICPTILGTPVEPSQL